MNTRAKAHIANDVHDDFMRCGVPWPEFYERECVYLLRQYFEASRPYHANFCKECVDSITPLEILSHTPV
jgi:hypothetical protein